jgi:hypothetical protein
MPPRFVTGGLVSVYVGDRVEENRFFRSGVPVR